MSTFQIRRFASGLNAFARDLFAYWKIWLRSLFVQQVKVILVIQLGDQTVPDRCIPNIGAPAIRQGQVLICLEGLGGFRGFFRYRSLGKYTKRFLENRNVVVASNPAANEQAILISIGKNTPFPSGSWKRRIILNLAYSGQPSLPNWLVYPFGVHPGLISRFRYWPRGTLVEEMRVRERLLLFLGNHGEEYEQIRCLRPSLRPLGRNEVLKILESHPRSRRVTPGQLLSHETPERNEFHYCLRNDPQGHVKQDNLIALCRRYDFFLCVPGYCMPMCHNFTESLSAGCIPITNCARWFSPPLQATVNCLSFETKEELLSLLDELTTIGPDEIKSLRAGAIEYFREWLAPDGAFARISEGKEDLEMFHLHSSPLELEKVTEDSVVFQNSPRF